jgi:hypothetical protein
MSHPWKIAVAPCLAAAALAASAVADGGQVVATATQGRAHAAMMVNPANPQVGPVAIIVHGSPGLLRSPCTLTAAAATGGAPIRCSMAAEPGGLGQIAVLDCDQATTWTITVRAATDQGDIELEARITIAPPLPSWRAQLPWALAWVPGAALLLLRQVARRRSALPSDDGGVCSTRRIAGSEPRP